MSFCLKIFLVYRNLQNKTTKIITLLPPATKLRQGNIFTPVCHSVHREGVCQSPRADTPQQTPPSRHPPRPVHAGMHPPLPSACWDTVNKRVVRIPLECILVFFVFPFTILKYIAILNDNTYHPYRTTLNRRHNI